MNPTRSTRRTGALRWIASATAAVLAAGALTLVATPAMAAVGDADDPNILGTLTLGPTAGSLQANPVFTEVSTTAGCPEGQRTYSRTIFYYATGTTTQINNLVAVRRNVSGDPFQLTGSAATAAGLPAIVASIPLGTNFHVLLTCEAVAPTSASAALTAGAKYFAATLQRTASNAWAVVAGPTPTPTPTTPAKTATTTGVAASAITQTSLTLTATVAPTAATGTVQFTNGGQNIGTPATVSGGTATTTVEGLTAGTAYTFGAAYSGDDAYNASSGTVQATTVAVPVIDEDDAELTVTVPEVVDTQPTGLRISSELAASIPLGSTDPRTQGQSWTATGQLGTVTVADDRRNASANGWSLNGTSSAFTSGTNPIAAAQLSWSPTKTEGAGTAGPGGPITTAPLLASGTASADRDVTTSVTAGLSLVVPATAAAGNYTATLTLTLI